MILEQLTKTHQLPLVGKILGRNSKGFSIKQLKKFKNSQNLALSAAAEVGKMLAPGWTEKKAAKYLDQFLKDNGVKGYLHKPFAWFGDRTRFRGCKNYLDYMPTNRELKEDEVVILDVAPIVDGFPSDIGHSLCLGENAEFDKAMTNLRKYKKVILEMFEDQQVQGKDIWLKINRELKDDGYDNIHQKYPMHVLGHRMYPMPFESIPGILKPFSWQAYWSLSSRGLFTETLTSYHKGNLNGLWAIEPHLGAQNFGVKFEEMIFVKDGSAFWLSETEL